MRTLTKTAIIEGQASIDTILAWPQWLNFQDKEKEKRSKREKEIIYLQKFFLSR